jgi:hypothetical protein
MNSFFAVTILLAMMYAASPLKGELTLELKFFVNINSILVICKLKSGPEATGILLTCTFPIFVPLN